MKILAEFVKQQSEVKFDNESGNSLCDLSVFFGGPSELQLW